MAFVQAKCTACGANLKVDSSLEAANCEYCGSAFIVEKAINNYNIENAQINVQTVNVNIQNKLSDFVIEGGVLKKYKGNDSHVTIPNTVVEIADDAFFHCICLTEVTIPKSVKKINGRSFELCDNLKNINVEGDTVLAFTYNDGIGYNNWNTHTGESRIIDWVNGYSNSQFIYTIERFIQPSYGKSIKINGVDVFQKLKPIRDEVKNEVNKRYDDIERKRKRTKVTVVIVGVILLIIGIILFAKIIIGGQGNGLIGMFGMVLAVVGFIITILGLAMENL